MSRWRNSESTNEQQKNLGQKMDLFSSLERTLEQLYNKAEQLKTKVESDTAQKRKIESDQQRRKRADLAKSKANEKGEFPQGFFDPDFEQQLKQAEITTKENYKWSGILKNIFITIVLVAVLWMIIILYRNLNETEKKFKD